MDLLRLSYRFILLPSFAGLFCFGCQSYPGASKVDGAGSQKGLTQSVTATPLSAAEPQAEQAAEKQAPPEQTAQSPSQPTPKPSPSAAYNEAINLASSAYQLSQSAVSPDDWGLIKSRWGRAVEQLESISEDDQNYTVAQQKITDYRLSARQAQAQIESLQNPVYVPLPPRSPKARPQPTRPNITTNRSQITTALGTANQPSGGQVAEVPIVRRLHGTPIVRVVFNGTQTYDMILDTGASRTLITRQMANELGVVATERMVASTASEAEVIFDIGQVNSISMGGITLSNARVSIGDSVDVGLLGNDFLRGYDVTIRAGQGLVELAASN